MKVKVVDAAAISVNCSSKRPARNQSIERYSRIIGQEHFIDTGSDSPSRRGIGARRAVEKVGGMQLGEVSFELFVGGVDFLKSSKGGGPRKS